MKRAVAIVPAHHKKHVVKLAHATTETETPTATKKKKADESETSHTVKLAHATTEAEAPAATAEKTEPTPVPPAATTPKKAVHKGYGADDRRALNRLIESTGNGGGQ